MGDEDKLVWARPINAKRYHIFEGIRSIGSCSWMFSPSDRDTEVDPDNDTFVEGEDCKSCARKAGVLDD